MIICKPCLLLGPKAAWPYFPNVSSPPVFEAVTSKQCSYILCIYKTSCVLIHTLFMTKALASPKRFFFCNCLRKKYLSYCSVKKTRQQVLSWNLACFFFRLYGIRICLFHGSTNVMYDVFGLLLGRMTPTDSGQMRTVLIWKSEMPPNIFP